MSLSKQHANLPVRGQEIKKKKPCSFLSPIEQLQGALQAVTEEKSQLEGDLQRSTVTVRVLFLVTLGVSNILSFIC